MQSIYKIIKKFPIVFLYKFNLYRYIIAYVSISCRCVCTGRHEIKKLTNDVEVGWIIYVDKFSITCCQLDRYVPFTE